MGRNGALSIEVWRLRWPPLWVHSTNLLKLMTLKYDMAQVLNWSTDGKTQKLFINREGRQKVRNDFSSDTRQKFSVIWRLRTIKDATSMDDVPRDLNRKRPKRGWNGTQQGALSAQPHFNGGIAIHEL